MSFRIQEVIHKFELGAGARVMRFVLIGVVVLGLAVIYDSMAFRNLATQEAMDAAQLGRNLAEGKGFSTQFIRPFSLFLLERHRGEAGINTNAPLRHPDLANAPLYPALLGIVLKANPFGEPDLSKQQSFSVYMPDLWIAVFNQALLVLAAALVFALAKYLFDAPVAWVSTIVFMTTELFWRFSVSGLSTALLISLILVLAAIVARIENAIREAPTVAGPAQAPINIPAGGLGVPRSKLVRLALAAGAIVGVATMTRYSMACLMVPLLILLASSISPHKVLLMIVSITAFLVVIAPWTVRNIHLSGTPFGTAGFAIVETTSHFPENELERSLHPALGLTDTGEYWRKLTTNLREIVVSDLPKAGGNWISALFLAGLLMPFRNPVLGRMRLFLILSIATLAVAQALGRTSLSADSPEINSENLLVTITPIVFIYGASLFFVLRDQLNLQGPAARGVVWAAFYGLAAAPLIMTVFAPHPSPVIYPPYYPPWIQQKAQAVAQGEAIMSDVPWAVAWYGHRPSVWLSLKHMDRASTRPKDDFYAVDRACKVRGLYLTGKSLKTLDIKALSEWSRTDAPDVEWENFRKLVTEAGQALIDDNVKQSHVQRLQAIYAAVERNWVRGSGDDWESFVLGIFVKREVPTGFPLRRVVGGLMPEIFLTDSESEATKGHDPAKR